MPAPWTPEQREAEVGPQAKLKVIAAQARSVAADIDLAIEEASKKRACCSFEAAEKSLAAVEAWCLAAADTLAAVTSKAAKLRAITDSISE